MTIAHGGKNIYGARLGVLMLESRFPRIPGDMGNASTWPFPVMYRVVRGASPERVVQHRAEGLLEAFLEAADELVREGADGITTTCGFLSLYQADLARHCGVPVATSTLLQVPLVQRLLPPERRVGVITISAENLTEAHLVAAGAPADTPVVGTEGGREFTRAILGNGQQLDVEAAQQDLLDAAAELTRRHPEVGAIVFECANMAPYAKVVRDRTGLPVYDIFGFVSWFHSGLQPRDFSTQLGSAGIWRER